MENISKGTRIFIAAGLLLAIILFAALYVGGNLSSSSVNSKKTVGVNNQPKATVLSEEGKQEVQDLANKIKTYYTQKYQK